MAPTIDEILDSRVLQKFNLDKHDLVLFNSLADGKRLHQLQTKLRKTNRGWKGVILHLKPGEELGKLGGAKAFDLYMALMQEFNKPLWDAHVQAIKAKVQLAKEEQEAKEAMESAPRVEVAAPTLLDARGQIIGGTESEVGPMSLEETDG